jgi:Sulfotransferase family
MRTRGLGSLPVEDFPAGPRALFVLGSPRSGTTLIGSYLASGQEVLDLGEYGGFHLAHNIAPATLGAIPGNYREQYLGDLVDHARRFAEDLAGSQGRKWYCDTTPWNLLVADRLAVELPDALFVLMLRHYSGAVQSLRRSFESGFAWAGQTWAESARIWAHVYASVERVPADRTVAVSYEALTDDPETVLGLLRAWLDEHGFPVDDLDASELAVSHAPPSSGPRPTIATRGVDGVELRSISSFDPDQWSDEIHRTVWPFVESVHRDLAARFPSVYVWPMPPAWLSLDVELGQPERLGAELAW